ncbi:hypothetical protein ACFS27_13555 [Promicromonospora vindobonensis]|uniref:MFS transporter n=1 Tax=Promicromonospora vindobonensis TaxID=195748 RepID=A0ABW5VSA8_9MICO
MLEVDARFGQRERAAFLVGPPLIGPVAHATGYRLAVLVLLIPMVLALVQARSVRPLPTAPGVKR